MHHPIGTDHPNADLERAAGYLRFAERVVVLTGAGVSAESGVPTFRDAGGLWEGHRVEDVATPEAFARDPRLVWKFYNLRRSGLRTVRPNPGHHALAALEQRLGPERFTLVTQNVDGLHQVAGSCRVLELHGSIARVRCTACPVRADRGSEVLDDLPHCEACGALLRPDIVWFHEMLPEVAWEEAMQATYRCQCFLVVGTSAVVYPAAGLIDVARVAGARIIEVNLTRTAASQSVDVGLYGASGEILPQLVERALASREGRS
jgi:NAD-dependent deacetylase